MNMDEYWEIEKKYKRTRFILESKVDTIADILRKRGTIPYQGMLTRFRDITRSNDGMIKATCSDVYIMIPPHVMEIETQIEFSFMVQTEINSGGIYVGLIK